jgi:HD-GYP domain-containing protein (c-di-GMP phosphodiesterase class II)
MSGFNGMIDQEIFLEKVATSVEDTCATDNNFSLIYIRLKNVQSNKDMKELYGFLANCINRAIVNKKDCFSFWDDAFYILSFLDSEDIVHDFLNSIALRIEKSFGKEIAIFASYVRYPYDIIDAKDVMPELKNRFKQIIPVTSDLDVGLINDANYNQVIGSELTNYLLLMKQYGRVLYDHSLFVSKISTAIAKALELPNAVIKKIMIAAILHDVGYTVVPRSILTAKNQKNVQNLAWIKLHPILATRKVLKDKSILKEVFPIIEQHHEYIDGSGYPFGLSYKEMTLEAQIISIADTYDLIRMQKNVSDSDIIHFFISGAGIRWDEKLVTIFTGILMEENWKAWQS